MVETGRVRGDAEPERALAHRGPRREDDQVPRLEARRHLVEIVEPAREPGHGRAELVQRLHPFERLDERAAERHELAAVVSLRDLEEPLLGLRDEVARRLAAILRKLDDVLARAEQAAEDRELAHRLRVVGGVRRRGHDLRDLVYARLASGGGRLAGLLELRVHRDGIDGMPGAPQPHRRPEDRRKIVAVEIGRRDVLEHGGDRGLGTQDGADNRDLRVLVVEELVRRVGEGRHVGHVGIEAHPRGTVKGCGSTGRRPRRQVLLSRRKEHMFP